MIPLFLFFACAQAPYDPITECQNEDRTCCDNSECGSDEICHFVYVCKEMAGKTVCEEPVGDRECHDLCTEQDGEPFVCEEPTQSCQEVEFVQGDDVIGSEIACF